MTTTMTPSKRPLILLIDDSICTRTLLETALRREGYATLGFADGVAALRWLTSEEAQIPSLIILDLKMPKMDGYTVLLHLRERAATAKTPVIILSGRDGIIDRLKGHLAGGNAYLTKPFKPETIQAAVQEQLVGDTALVEGRS
jgi:twitching motility two-component system response regulator PilG